MSVLEGLKVIDLTRGCCGAYAAMQLADYGARVVRPGEPPLDPAQDALHFGMEYQPDLQLPKGLEGAGVLLAEADTLPDGLTRSVLRAQYPKLVCAVIREDGAVGGPLAEAACGMMDMTGFPDGAPTLSGGQSAECFAGVSLCFAITAALQNAENGGEGAWIDYSLYDTFYSLLESPILFRELTGTCPGRCGSAQIGGGSHPVSHHPVMGRMEGHASLHGNNAFPCPLYPGSHGQQKALQIHDLRLPGGPHNGGDPFPAAGGQHGVFRSPHAGDGQADLPVTRVRSSPAAAQAPLLFQNLRPQRTQSSQM